MRFSDQRFFMAQLHLDHDFEMKTISIFFSSIPEVFHCCLIPRHDSLCIMIDIPEFIFMHATKAKISLRKVKVESSENKKRQYKFQNIRTKKYIYNRHNNPRPIKQAKTADKKLHCFLSAKECSVKSYRVTQIFEKKSNQFYPKIKVSDEFD